MKVFISWSGDLSKSLAEAVREWLPGVLQAVKPYFSPDDVAKGSRWSNEVAKELSECSVGLICITRDNLEAPWVMFEAGALSKSLSASRVCPLLFGVAPSDIKGPLVQFQAASFNKEEMRKVLRTINDELRDAGLTGDVFDSVFEMWWPKLEAQIKAAMAAADKASAKKVRTERDILEEILALVRGIPGQPSGIRLSPGAGADLVDRYKGIVEEVLQLEHVPSSKLIENLQGLYMPIDYLMRRIPEWESIKDRSSCLHETHASLREFLESHLAERKEGEERDR